MKPDKKELVALVLRKFVQAQPSATLFNEDVTLLNEMAALEVLRYNGVQLFVNQTFKMDSELRKRLVCSEMQEDHFQKLLGLELKRVVSILRSAGVPALVVKGLSMNRYYPEGLTRPTSDVDLIVPPVKRDQSLDVLLADGYFSEDKNIERSLDLGGEVGLRAEKTGISIELHWDLVNSRSMRKATRFDMDQLFSLSKPCIVGGCEVLVPPIEIEALYLMVHHVMHHEFTRLIWFLDVVNLLYTENIDFDKLASYAREYRAQRPVHYVLSAAKHLVPEYWSEEHQALLKAVEPLPLRYHMFKIAVPHDAILKGVRSKWMNFRHHIFRNAFK